METPKTFKELFDFYHSYVRLLYSEVQTHNWLPQETLFEINAAFDHISRHWAFDHDEASEVEKAFSHLKRSCLDIFKLKVKETIDKYRELQRIDTSLIDNGEYERRMREAIHLIRHESKLARREDAQSIDEEAPAFPRWDKVYAHCVAFEEQFYLNKSLDWARKKSRIFTWKTFLLGIAGSLIAGLLLGLLL